MARRRTFTAKFKTPVVLDLLTGRRRMAHSCREHDLKEHVVTRWRAAVLDGAETVFGTDIEPQRHLERIAERERMVGGLTLELEIAKKASQLWTSRATSSGS
jgi:transposase